MISYAVGDIIEFSLDDKRVSGKLKHSKTKIINRRIPIVAVVEGTEYDLDQVHTSNPKKIG